MLLLSIILLLSYTRRAIGYPSHEILKSWIEEFYPNARPLVIRSGTNKCFSPEERSQAVRKLCNRRGTARKVAQSIGVSVPVLYKWKKDLISDEAYQSMRKRKAAPQDKNQDALLGEIQRLRQQMRYFQSGNHLYWLCWYENSYHCNLRCSRQTSHR